MDNVDQVINKSLNDIDALIASLQEGNKKNDEISKGLPPEEVSQDAPTPDEGDGGEPPVGDEGEPPGGADTDESEPPVSQGDEGVEDEEDEDYEKSLESEMNSNDGVRKALEVSEFLSELVKGISTVLSRQEATVNKSLLSNEDSNTLLAKSFEGLVKAQGAILETTVSLQKSVHTLADRMETLERQPQVRKSVSGSAKPVAKSFAGQTKKKTEGQGTLSKSEAVGMLATAYEQGNHALRNDILSLESTGNFGVLSQAGRSVLGL